jgi:glycosyltransferase involved in cell wall biosynthesis
MERVVAELVRRIDRDRFETHILALEYMGEFGEGVADVAALHVAAPMPRWSMFYPRALAAQISAIAPDVVHLHSGVLYKASLAASIAGVPYQIYTDHGRQNPDPWTYRAIDRRASRRIDSVVAVSARLGGQLARFLKFPDRIQVIHNGVDTERFIPGSDDNVFRREIGIEADVPVIGSTGRLEPVKGYDVMLHAFALLRNSRETSPAPVLVLVGDGSERASLERIASDLGISDSVHFVGWRNDIEQISQTFSVFCMSSHSEGTSVSLLEAMSAGLPPVVTNVGGNAEVLGSELEHRMVPAANPAALALTLANALGDPAALARDSISARARIVDHFSLDAMVRRYGSLYGAAQHTSEAAW